MSLNKSAVLLFCFMSWSIQQAGTQVSTQSPILVTYPPAIALGKIYIVECITPHLDFTNGTLSLFKRPYTVPPGNQSFEYIGSRALNPKDSGGSIKQTGAFEFKCEIEMLYKGNTVSMSNIIAAIPEELPIRLHSPNSDTATCAGNLYMKSKDEWKPICFPVSKDKDDYVATVACQDLGCGSLFDAKRIDGYIANYLGTPNCTGNEKKVADCPLMNLGCSHQFFHIICKDAVTPPKFSVLGYNPGSWLYIKSEESLTITCSFESTSFTQSDTVYIAFTFNGKTLYTTSSSTGLTERYRLYAPVEEGEYACQVNSYSRLWIQKTSNSVGIYIYTPPPTGAVVAGVLTAVAGIAILVFLCVYRTSEEEQLLIQPAATEQEPQETSEIVHTDLPQV